MQDDAPDPSEGDGHRADGDAEGHRQEQENKEGERRNARPPRGGERPHEGAADEAVRLEPVGVERPGDGLEAKGGPRARIRLLDPHDDDAVIPDRQRQM